MRPPPASVLADRLTAALPAVGSVSRDFVASTLFRYSGPLTDQQIEAVLRIAACRGQIIHERGGSTLARKKP